MCINISYIHTHPMSCKKDMSRTLSHYDETLANQGRATSSVGLFCLLNCFSMSNMSWCLKNLRICCIFRGLMDWCMLEFLHTSRKSQAAKVKNGRRCRTITSQKVKQQRLYLGLSGVTGMTCMLYHTIVWNHLRQTMTFSDLFWLMPKNVRFENPAADA